MPRSTSTRRLPEPIFYADENFGQGFVSSLRVNGNLQVRAAKDFFPGQDDVLWIPAVASNGWTAITKDERRQHCGCHPHRVLLAFASALGPVDFTFPPRLVSGLTCSRRSTASPGPFGRDAAV